MGGGCRGQGWFGGFIYDRIRVFRFLTLGWGRAQGLSIQGWQSQQKADFW